MQMDLPLNKSRNFLNRYLPTINKNIDPYAHQSHLMQEITQEFHPQVRDLPLNADLSYPHNLNGLTLLNVTANSTQNNFVLSSLVGNSGSVIALEADTNAIDLAQRALIEQQDELDPIDSNLEFFEGSFEKLHELRFSDEEFDLMISYRDFNKSDLNRSLLNECHRILSEGGEFILTEIFSSRRLEEEVKEQLLSHSKDLANIFYLPDFIDILMDSGFLDIRVMDIKPYSFHHSNELKELSAQTFFQITLRLFKLKDLEKREEDYGQMVKYNGGVHGMEEDFKLSLDHHFQKGKWQAVSGNTFLILNQSRFEHHFDFAGDFTKHFGAF